jgi:hypothetical protein
MEHRLAHMTGPALSSENFFSTSTSQAVGPRHLEPQRISTSIDRDAIPVDFATLETQEESDLTNLLLIPYRWPVKLPPPCEYVSLYC